MLGFILFTAAGCHWAAPQVQMFGTPASLDELTGQWSGQYVGDASHGRSGNIAFRLSPGTHEAQGDVMMTPDGGQPYGRFTFDDPTGQRPPRRADQFLSIRFVEVERGVVRGRLDPYWDPDRQSVASTVFVGRIGDDVIEGTFSTTYRNGDPSTGGTWKVQRTRQ